MFDDDGVNDLFEALFGRRSGGGGRRRSAAVKGQDLETETTISLDDAYHGTARLIRLNEQTIKVTIKPGVVDRQMLRIEGKGGIGMNGGRHGDLFLTVKIAPHAEFQRSGNDLYCDLPVGLYTALLGGKTTIKTLKGTVTVTVPKGTSNGKELSLRGLGMPLYASKHEFGNLFVKVHILLPEQLTEKEIEMFSALASLRQ
jgi:curved DNA-binding protein